MPVFDDICLLDSQVEAALSRGWSVLPLVGGADAAVGKRPACRWQVYTRRRPSLAEVQAWFADSGRRAYGVICGAVSGLVVLDLDDPQVALRFAQTFPELLDTFTVRSGLRGTPHLYWRVDFPVSSRAFPGGDLKAEGSYVVGPGSRIAGATWQVIADRPLRFVSPVELERVLAFLLPSQPAASSVSVSVAVSPQLDFAGLYSYFLARFQGRNRALFLAACAVRDAGLPLSEAFALLADRHALQPSPVDGRLEPYAGRLREAERTIQSAYSRPPRQPLTTPDGQPVSRCPNSVRETLLALPSGAAVARLIEACVLLGLKLGAVVSEPLLCARLKGFFSRETIRKALAACYPDGAPIFCPPDHPPAEADIPGGIDRQKNAFLSGGQKQTARKWYVLPTFQTLTSRLGVPARGSDPLTLADVRSAKAYRQALHEALLRRRPGRYSQALLAARIGLSARSIRRYNAQLGVQTCPTYTYELVDWVTVERLPTASDIRRYEIDTGGQCLQDETGKKWPLQREIARRLLSAGHQVLALRQGCSFYTLADAALLQRPAERAGLTDGVALAPLLASFAQPLRVELPGQPVRAICQPAQSSPDFAQEGPFLLSEPQKAAPQRQRPQKRKFRRPLADPAAERAAQRAYQQVGDLSLPNARRLVDIFGSEPVSAALRKLNWLRARGGVRSPAALLVTLARVSWRVRQRRDDPGLRAPRFAAEPQRRSRSSGYVHPKNDPVWRSPVYQEWRAEFFGSLDDALAHVTVEEMTL